METSCSGPLWHYVLSVDQDAWYRVNAQKTFIKTMERINKIK